MTRAEGEQLMELAGDLALAQSTNDVLNYLGKDTTFTDKQLTTCRANLQQAIDSIAMRDNE